MMLPKHLRRWVDQVRHTPLHPQWLLGDSTQAGAMIRRHATGLVLDVGCADRWAQAAMPAGAHYICLDYPPTGRDRYRAQPDVFADAAVMPLADGCADTVLLFEVLEHVRHPQQALHEIARILRANGRLLLTVPFLYPVHDAPYDFQRYTAHGLAREIAGAGLDLVECEPTLDTARSLGVLASLGIAALLLQSWRRRRVALLIAVPLAAMIPVVNVLAWVVSRLVPSWDGLTTGYRVVAVKQ